MQIRVLTIMVLLLAPMLCFGNETDEEYERLVDEILETTGALEIGVQMSDLIVAQMFEALKAADKEVPDRAYDALEDEVISTINDAIASGSFSELMYPIYRKYLSRTDLEAMVRFYRTEEGKRIAEAIPVMAQEAMQAGQVWGTNLSPEIARRVRERLASEGIEL